MSEFEQIAGFNNDTYLWLDFEFTGLDISKDVVLEIGAVFTRGLFDVQGEFEVFVNHPAGIAEKLINENEWWQGDDRSSHRDTILGGVNSSHMQIDDAAAHLHGFVTEHASGTRATYLAGNSIHNDRKWLERDFRDTDELLHYRMLDVSALKLVVASTVGIQVVKNESHRALSDIYESMHELESLLRIIRNGNE